MKNNIILLKVLLLLNLTVFCELIGNAQTKIITTGLDTIHCYGRTELKHITKRVIRAKECDTLIVIANIKIENQEILISNKNTEIGNLNRVISLKDNIITEKDSNIENYKKESKKNKFKLIFVKITSGIIIVVEAVIFTTLILR